MAVSTLIAQTQYATGFTVPAGGVLGDSIAYDYSTMPGNQPQTNADTVFLWQTGAQMIPATSPQSTQAVGSNSEDGSDSFSDLTVTTDSYLIGFGVGADVANICAT